MKKNQSGITLIALVITIIVLLILAGVSIAMLTGENGILRKASSAKNASAIGEVEEAVKLGIAEIQADKMDTVSTSKGTNGIISSKNIATAAIRNNASISETTKEGVTNSTDTGATEYRVYLTLNGTEYTAIYTPSTTTGSGDTATTTPASLSVVEGTVTGS